MNSKISSNLFLLAALCFFAGHHTVGAEVALQVTPDLAYLGPDRTEKLDLYLPAPPPAGTLSPALVWIHGGGWSGGTRSEARAKNICTTLAEAGYVAVSIDYRLGAGAWPTNLFDCKNAVRYLRANAAKYRLDPRRIAVAGGSAGGHLALMVALTAGREELEPPAAATPYPGVSSAVRCVINFYGVTNFLTWRTVDKQGNRGELRAPSEGMQKTFGFTSAQSPTLSLISPVTHVTRHSVPMMTLHGKVDASVEYLQAEELDRVARERGARHELWLIEGVGHTFDFRIGQKKPLPADLRSVVLEFLAKH